LKTAIITKPYPHTGIIHILDFFNCLAAGFLEIVETGILLLSSSADQIPLQKNLESSRSKTEEDLINTVNQGL